MIPKVEYALRFERILEVEKSINRVLSNGIYQLI